MTIRKIIISLLLMLSYGCGRAQQVTQGTISSLTGVHAVTVEYDFSNALVDGIPLNDYIEISQLTEGDSYRQEFEQEKKEIIADFIEEFNDTNCPILLTISTNPAVSMLIQVKSISRNGNTITCDYTFKEKSSGHILAEIALTAKDGRCGSFSNLMGDAFEEAGKKLGKFIKKNLKSSKR